MKRAAVPLVLLALASCVAEGEEADDLAETAQAATVFAPLQNPIDPPLGKQGVADLRTSQLVRLPASWFLDAAIERTGAHRMVVRTSCGAVQAERRDTGLLVVKKKWMKALGWTVVDARYNDDAIVGACTTCSRVDLGSVSSGTYRYDVYAFSNQRTKAQCFVEYSINAGGNAFDFKLAPPGHPPLQPLDLGGALVELGPVERNAETFEVKTTNDGGAANSRTDAKMLVFDVGGTRVDAYSTYRSRYAPVLARDLSATDRDPRVQGLGYSPIELGLCNDPPCAEPKHFALVGLEPNPSSFTSSFIDAFETTLSLVRGPEDKMTSEGGVADAVAPIWVKPNERSQCGEPIDVGIGRFSATVRALSTGEYGEDRGLRGDMSWQIANWDPQCSPGGPCPPPLVTPSDDLRSYFYRGMPNFLGFTMRVEGRTSSTAPWAQLTAPRQVPNGAFGCGDNRCWDTFLEDFELYVPSQVRLCVDRADDYIVFEGLWGVRRNGPSAELKVATFNGHHGDTGIFDSGGLENDAESRNMSNLLATRGRFTSSAKTVIERDTDAPFEWNADVVALQEHSWLNSYESFLAEAEFQTDLDWRYVWGYGKAHFSTGYLAKNAVFSHGLLAPAGTLLPPDTTGCGMVFDPTISADGQSQCWNNNDSSDTGGVDYRTYSVPAQISVRRWNAGGDVPVLVLSVMLQPGGSTPRFHARRSELEDLIEQLEDFVVEHPELVGASVADPEAANVRIVLAGDFNFYPHRVGENRWFVRELRRVFGYAVDVAAAHRDSYENFYDMHSWRGVPYGAWPTNPDGDNGDPIAFTTGQEWRGLDDTTTWWWWSSQDWPHYFPYWARTYFGSKLDYDGDDAGHDRHDGVILVGKGWANDDAVRGYVVMNTTTEFDEYNDPAGDEQRGSPFAIKDWKGNVVAVDIAPGSGIGPSWAFDMDVWNNASWPEQQFGHRDHYKPQRDISDDSADGCTDTGCAAVESDHIPVGVRLRITAPVGGSNGGGPIPSNGK